MVRIMRLGNMIFLCLSISIIVVCNAQDSESRIFAKQSVKNPTNNDNNGDDEKFQKQQESIEALMKDVGDMGMLLENYRRVIISGVSEINDICSFIERISSPDDKSIESEIKNLIISDDT